MRNEPLAAYHDYRDLYGNAFRRATLPAVGACAVRYDAVAEVCPNPTVAAPAAIEHFPAGDLPDDVLLYALPSRYGKLRLQP